MPLTTASRQVSQDSSNTERLVDRGYLVPFVLVTFLFFLWALPNNLPNNLNDVLIRQFMKLFAISRFQAGLLQCTFSLGYFLLATHWRRF
jgi:MFS transporter, FHS family, L-fucose permease